ncbi:MAG: 2-hydroxyacid dehydrogenase [Xanthobacteraceae bacterium]|nr:2-hydroxyacid dehydrogenase [Bradyrhizobium sp.]
MPEKVLILHRFPKSQMVRIGQSYALLDAAGKNPGEAFSAEELRSVRVVLAAGGRKLGGDIMDMLPGLGAIICYGTGYDGVDLKAAAARNIAIGNSPGANASSVADMALALTLASVRRILVADGFIRDGSWAASKPSPLMRPQLGMGGRKVGIYGMGEIGRRIAARVAAFESEVGYFSRSRHDVPYLYLESLEALADWCSVLIIAVRAGPETHHIVNADILRRLGEDGHVVNIARGSVLDQGALVVALRDKTIAGAGLDVFAREPHAPDELTALPNVVLAPHVGGHTLEGHVAMQDCVLANLEAFFAGRPLPYAVSS